MRKSFKTHNRKGRTRFGCGVRMVDTGDCLALAVTERSGQYRLAWAHFGQKASGAFSVALRRRAGWKPVWVPIFDREAEMNMVIRSVDLKACDEQGKKLASVIKPEDFVRTQVGKHVPTQSKDDFYVCDHVHPTPDCEHVVGAAARRGAVDQTYHFWRHDLGVHAPHVSAVAIGLANTALALMPGFSAQDTTARLIVLEAYHATYGCYFQGLRLECALRYEPAQEERLHPGLLEMWEKTLRSDSGLKKDETLAVRVVQSWPIEDKPSEIDAQLIWNPWESASLAWPNAAARNLLFDHLDLAPVAFGLALQGS